MKNLKTAEYQPEVHYANYIPVRAGQSWGPRIIQDFELILIVAGGFSYSDIEVGTVVCEVGDVLCILPGREHTLRNERTPEKREAVISCIHLEMMQGSFLHDEYQMAAPPPLVTRTGNDPVVHELFKRCENIYTGFSPNRDALLQAVAWEILLHLEEFREGGTACLSPRMRHILRYIQHHVHEPLTRADLAREFAISPEHVNALFKKELNSTPTKQIHRAKIFRAYTYLTYDGLSVKETAEKLSFYDEFYFSKVFKRVIGLPPSRIRLRSSATGL